MSDKSLAKRTVGGGKSGKKKYRHVRCELTSDQMDELRQAFDMFDEVGEGSIPNSQIKIMLRALGYEPKRDEIKKILLEVDPEKEGSISFDEFVHIMSFKLKEKDSTEEMMRAFKLFDEENSGKITISNLKRVAKELGQSLTDEELQEMMDEADVDGDGQISPAEFMAVMKKAHLL